MPSYNLPLMFALLLLCASKASAERVLDHYDVDSLTAQASLIVKAEIGPVKDVKTPDGNCAVWEVTVRSCLHGDVKAKDVLRVTGIEAYRKWVGIDGVGADANAVRRLSRGDIVYLFLAPKGAPGGYSKHDLTDADWKVIESGTRLAAKNRVYSFAQYWPSGFNSSLGFVTLTEATNPRKAGTIQKKFKGPLPILTQESFEKKLKASLKFVAGLKLKLSENRLTETERKAVLDSRAAVLEREWATTDYIPRFMRLR